MINETTVFTLYAAFHVYNSLETSRIFVFKLNYVMFNNWKLSCNGVQIERLNCFHKNERM